MLSHIATDLHNLYLEEVFKPQLGKPGASTPPKEKTSPSDIDGDGDVDSFEKKVRQFIYDVRHLMKRNNIPVEKAFQMRSSKTNYGADVVKAAKEKLGIKVGGSIAVSEERETRMVSVTINYQNGTVDRRNVPYDEVARLRAKPTVRSVEISSNRVSYSSGAGEKYEKNYGSGKGKNTVGDRDGDGTREDDRHEYAGVKDNAIKKAVSKRRTMKGYGVSEGFSNWRQDLKEVMGIEDERASRKVKEIKEREIDNYADKTVNLKPEVTEKTSVLGGYVVESVELDESYCNNAIEIATEFFYNSGLNENGVEIVIEELGQDKFVEFVFDLAEEYLLSEARRGPGGTKVRIEPVTPQGKPYKSGRPTEKGLERLRKKKKERTKKEKDESEAKPSGLTAALRSQSDTAKRITADKAKNAVEKAKETQAPSSQPDKNRSLKDTIARGVLSAWKGHQAAMKSRKSGGNTGEAIRSGLGAASDAFKKKGTAHFREWVNNLLDEGYDLSNWTIKQLQEEFNIICEKAESEQQQKLFGLALSVKRGETPRSEASAEVLKIVDTMSVKKIRDFAKTKHEGIPHKVDEAIVNPRESSRQRSPRTTREQQSAATISLLRKLMKQRLKEDSYDSLGDPKLASLLSRKAKNDQTGATIERQVSSARSTALKKQNKPEPQQPQTQNSSYEPEGEVIDERARARRGQPRPDTKNPAWRAMRIVKDAQNPEGVMTRSGGTVAQHRRRRGVPGKYEPPGLPKQTTPAQRLAKRKAPQRSTSNYENDVYSKDGLGGIRGYRSGD